MLRAALGVAAAAAVLVAVWGCRPNYDKYDEVVRGTHKIPGAVNFGQTIGPDGDGCWVEADEGKVYCDLISIGGLHWDTGAVRVEPPVPVELGSGWLCLGTADRDVACWEWSSEVMPRRAPAPEGAEFRRLVGGAGDGGPSQHLPARQRRGR